MPPEITAFPQPQLRHWLAHPRPFSAALSAYTSLHSSGRAAIYWAIRGLQLSPETIVKIPAYHCGAEVQAVLDAGLKVEFYRVRPDLSIDLDDLEQKLMKQRGPVFVIHYFGFGQPDLLRVVDMCRQMAVPWVEDCAHALFSNSGSQPLGRLATLAVFSLRKILPLFEGGAFQVNPPCPGDHEYPVALPQQGRVSMSVYRSYLREGIRRLAGDRTMDRYLRLRRGGQEPCEPCVWSGALQERHHYADRLSPISLRVAAATDPDAVVAMRRRAWVSLHAGLAGAPGYSKVFEELPEGVCPLFLPIRASQRDALEAAFRQEQIETFVFGKYPHENLDLSEFPESARLRDEILCLPVHQELRAEHFERMITVARPLLAKYGWVPRR